MQGMVQALSPAPHKLATTEHPGGMYEICVDYRTYMGSPDQVPTTRLQDWGL